MWERELEVAKMAAIEAGHTIMKIYGEENFATEWKVDQSPLTIADKESNRVIVGYLRQAFSNYSILSEEEKDDKKRLENDYCFVVDPLDGTKEFIKRNGQFTVNIALAYKHRVVVGVIYVPVQKCLYFASEGNGAYNVMVQDSLALNSPQPVMEVSTQKKLHVSTESDISKLRVVMSSSHGCAEMERLIEEYHLTHFVRLGSSLKGCLVAEGKADVYFRHNPTMEWDTAAMQCIVEEAGGIFRQMDDSEMLYNRVDSLNAKGFYAINVIDNRLR
jgi:3'(2'), 5'-bisphosphate nucleotidase